MHIHLCLRSIHSIFYNSSRAWYLRNLYEVHSHINKLHEPTIRCKILIYKISYNSGLMKAMVQLRQLSPMFLISCRWTISIILFYLKSKNAAKFKFDFPIGTPYISKFNSIILRRFQELLIFKTSCLSVPMYPPLYIQKWINYT